MTRLHVGSLALRPAILPMGNLQPLVTQTLLPGAKEVYGQLPLLDFNQLELQPFTAYGQVLQCHISIFDCKNVVLQDLTPQRPPRFQVSFASGTPHIIRQNISRTGTDPEKTHNHVG